jgi:hypothetical protein
MRRIIVITTILLAFCFCTVAQKENVTKEDILKKSPGILVLEQLSDKYSPVIFNHKLHIQPMAVMGIECSNCHHYSSPDSFPPCRKCHSQTKGEISSIFPLDRPGLEGAYHRKCISCHREWSQDIIDCSSCHAKKVAGGSAKSNIATENVDREHPVVEPKDKKVYTTNYHGGQIVTFLHKEHVELFEIGCVNCHKEGNCSLCHGEEKSKKGAKSELEIHKSCVFCHALENNCQQCHANTIKQQGFDHGQRTGWPLKQYHLKLNCNECHITKGKFSKLETACAVCHGGWSPKNFNHGVTGVALDENHREVDCEYCHPSSKFDETPSCSECHGEDIKYPERLPGTRTNEEGKK